MVDKAKTKRIMKQFTPKRTNIVSTGGVPLELPNHSRGKAPESDKGLVNQKYVDDQFPVTHASTTGQTTDDHHAEVHTHTHASTTGRTANDHHNESHDIASHSDTSATGAELDSLTDNSMADTLHRHSELSASDGSPDPALSVDATGNVGIGASSPLGNLHVKDTGESLAFIHNAGGFNPDYASTLRFIEGTGNGTFQGGYLRWKGDTNKLVLGVHNTADVITGNDNDVIAIDRTTGNVGIGTTSPEAPLDISDGGMTFLGGADLNAKTRTDATRKDFRIGAKHYTNAEEPMAMIFGIATDGDNQLFLGGGTAAMNAASNIRFHTAATSTTTTGTEAMRIDPAGNLGIGTASPTGKFTIKQSADTAGSGLRLIEAGSTDYWDVWLGEGQGENIDDFNIGRNGASPFMTILPTSGNVGIGTASPVSLLELQSNATTEFSMYSDVDGSAANDVRFVMGTGGIVGQWTFGIDGSNSNAFTLANSDGDLNSNPRMVIETGGQVGIGVTDPHSKLEVNGAISSATSTFSTAGPTDNVDVSGVNTLFLDPSSNNITIGGFAGGVDGQVLYIAIVSTSNSVTLEHAEGGGSQDILLHNGADETLAGEYGGWMLVCHGGNDWHDLSHAKHV